MTEKFTVEQKIKIVIESFTAANIAELCRRHGVSIAPIDSEEKLKERIKESFLELSCRLTFAKRWTVKFLNTSIIV